jgi:RNA polymerase sigma-70 factor (ECF subfamily)
MSASEQGREEARLQEIEARILQMAYLILGNPEEAEDVAQETVLRALEHRHDFRGEGDYFSWVCAIAVNLCRGRKNGRGKRSISVDPHSLERTALKSDRRGPATSALLRESHQRAALAVRSLPANLRETFVLHYLEGLPYEAVARIEGISAGAARLRALRARKALEESYAAGLDPAVRKRLGSPPESCR